MGRRVIRDFSGRDAVRPSAVSVVNKEPAPCERKFFSQSNRQRSTACSTVVAHCCSMSTTSSTSVRYVDDGSRIVQVGQTTSRLPTPRTNSSWSNRIEASSPHYGISRSTAQSMAVIGSNINGSPLPRPAQQARRELAPAQAPPGQAQPDATLLMRHWQVLAWSRKRGEPLRHRS